MSPSPKDQIDLRSLVLLAFSATAGVLVEYYDFFIFGYAAASAFPKIFFPDLSPTLALVFSFLIFGAGFPARLLGAFVFGHYGDRVGRKNAFLINLLMVGIATCLTGLLPGYATLGVAAPALLVAMRIIQGVGLGGEFGGASSLLAEFAAKRKHRAFWMSLANLGIPGGAMTASAVLFALSGNFDTIGWRIAMLLSALIVIPALLARYKLADTPLFERLRQQDQLSKLPSFDVVKLHARSIILLALVSVFQQMDGYVSGTYIIAFMHSAGIPLANGDHHLHQPPRRHRGRGAERAVGRPTQAQDGRLSRNRGCNGALLSVRAGNPSEAGRRDRGPAIPDHSVRHRPAARARADPDLRELSDEVSLLGYGHILQPVCHTRRRDRPSLLAGLIGPDVAAKWYFVPIVYAIYCVVAMASLLFIRETRDLPLEGLDREAATGTVVASTA